MRVGIFFNKQQRGRGGQLFLSGRLITARIASEYSPAWKHHLAPAETNEVLRSTWVIFSIGPQGVWLDNVRGYEVWYSVSTALKGMWGCIGNVRGLINKKVATDKTFSRFQR